MPAKSMRIERTEASTMRLYAVFFTVVPILAVIGLLSVGGLLANIGAIVCGAIAIQSVRANLRFAKCIEQLDDRVIVHPLWSKTAVTHSDLIEVEAQLALARNAPHPTLTTSYFTLRFPSGPVLVQPSAFPQAADFVESVLRATCTDFVFPLRLGDGVRHHWGRFPDRPSLGVTAGYRLADGTLVSLFLYRDESGADPGALPEEFERALADVAIVCAKKRASCTVSERSTTTISQLAFSTATLILGPRATKSKLLLTSWNRRFFKVRVTASPGREIPSDVVEGIVEAFVRAN